MRQRPPIFNPVGIGIVAGAAIGILIGALFSGDINSGLAIIVGVGLGVVIAASLDMRRRGGSDRGGTKHDE